MSYYTILDSKGYVSSAFTNPVVKAYSVETPLVNTTTLFVDEVLSSAGAGGSINVDSSFNVNGNLTGQT
jgi:hypothetical protein